MMHICQQLFIDLDASFALDPALLGMLRGPDDLRPHRPGELLHAYTTVLDAGFYVEVLEQRGGYDAYASADTHVRLAAQAPS